MSTRGSLLVFAVALAAMLVATFPLPLALDMAAAGERGLSAQAASGSLWRGRLSHARLHGATLGDAAVGLAPWPLLRGVRALDVETLALRARLVHGPRNGIDGLDGTIAVSDPAWLPGGELILHARDLRATFSGDACLHAGGRLSIAVQPPGAAAPAAELEGSAACEGQAWTLPLAPVGGQGALARLQARLQVHADGRWELDASVPGEGDPGERLALEALGFRAGPGGWSRTLQGTLTDQPGRAGDPAAARD